MHATDEAKVRRVLEDFNRAMREKDAAAAIALLAEDAVIFDLAPPLQLDAKGAHDRRPLDDWFATWDGPVEISSRKPTIAIGADVAYAYDLLHMGGRRTDGTTTDLWFRATACLRRHGGMWQITHMHHSVPMAMDGSGRALVDLTP